MKLKKVISLVLGGVMALSMLTACGSSSTTTSTEAAAAAVASSTTNTTVVNYIQSKLSAATVGSTQAKQTLTGNSEKALDTAVEAILNNGPTSLIISLKDVERTGQYKADNGEGIKASGHQQAGKTYVFAVAKKGYSDDDLAEAILTRMVNYHNASSTGPKYYVYDDISVFDATFTTNVYNNNKGTLVVGGQTVLDGSYDYWVVVVTVSSGSTSGNADFN